MGKALSVPYDIAGKILLPLAPVETTAAIITDKQRGMLQIVIGKRVYPLLQIREATEGKFSLVPWSKSIFSLPSWITSEALDQLRKDTADHELFQ